MKKLSNLKKFQKLIDSKLMSLLNRCFCEIHKINKEIFSKKNILTAQLFLYILCTTNGLKKSFDDTVSDLRLSHKLQITKGAIMNKRKLIKAKHIQKINDELVSEIFKNKKGLTTIVDGSYIYPPKSFTKFGFQLSNNGTCCKALLSVILDAETQIPISFHLHKTQNERAAFIKQLDWLDEEDLVIFDGGYFSNELVSVLKERKIDFIFRMSEAKNLIKELNKKKSNDLLLDYCLDKNKNIIKLRAIKYTYNDINKECGKQLINIKYQKARRNDKLRNAHKANTYYLITSLTNKFKRVDFMNLYNDRWGVETYFRYLKCDLSLNNIRSKSIETLKQDLCIHHFISIISLYSRAEGTQIHSIWLITSY